jgi:hypothetical protein
VSSDTRPRHLLIAELQKGLRLVYEGKEVVGEGIGFGVPVLLYSDDTYFSGSSRVYLSSVGDLRVIRKEFIIDRIQRKRFHKVRMHNSILRQMWRYLDRLYQKHEHLQAISSTDILSKLGIHFEFTETEPVGKVVSTYSISQDKIRVKMDFSSVRKTALRRIFVLNEQGSDFFRRYSDSDGTELLDREIGAWGFVKAQSARITDFRRIVGFEIWKTEKGALCRGRESIRGLANWTGLDYEIDPGNKHFEYLIRILGVDTSCPPA